MFSFKLEPEIPLLTIRRSGGWSVDTVIAYEAALRRQLILLQISGRPTLCIVDIRSTAAQHREVAEALRAMVSRIGPLRPDRTAVVSSSGIAKLQARCADHPNKQIFTSMVLARDWLGAGTRARRPLDTVHDKPSSAAPEGAAVHVAGPSDVDIMLTPAAALETAKRIGDAAIDVLLHKAQICLVEDRP